MTEKDNQISCYIHSVSPVKKSSGTSYVNCDLQTSNNTVVKAVCFEVNKKKTLESFAQEKSPVKIKNYNVSKKYGREDVVITKKTHLTPTTVDFDYQDFDKNISISTISQVAADQLVCVKGVVQQLSGTKTIVLDGNQVRKQQCYIVDPSGYVKLVFYGKHTNAVQEGKTFVFNKLRVKVTKDERFLNTPKTESECVISPAESFSETLPTVDAVSSILEVTGEILGVTNISKSQCCCSCNKKIVMRGSMACCEGCKMMQKPKACKVQWYARLYVEVISSAQQRLRLTAFNDVVNKLLLLCNLTPEAEPNQLVESVLKLDPLFLCYDVQTNKLIDLSIIDI